MRSSKLSTCFGLIAKRGFDCGLSAGRVVGRKRAGQQIMVLRILGQRFRRGLQRFGREGVVILVEGQLGNGEVRFGEIGLRLAERIVDQFQNLPRIGAAIQQKPAKRDAVAGRIESLRAIRENAADFLVGIFGLLFVCR